MFCLARWVHQHIYTALKDTFLYRNTQWHNSPKNIKLDIYCDVCCGPSKYFTAHGCLYVWALQCIFHGAFKCSDPGGSAHAVGHDSRDTEELDPGRYEERQTLHCP